MKLRPADAKRRLFVLALTVALGAAGGARAEGVKLSIDPEHSTVGFRVRHLFTKVGGQFRKFEGTIAFDQKDLGASKVAVTIQVATIDTNVEARDKDLRSKRFFDVEKHPTITFTSAGITDVAGDRGRIKGTLAMHGVAREVVLDAQFLGTAKDPWGNQRFGFHGETKINRKDYGMAWNETLETGGILVGDDVEILLDVEAVPAKP